MAKTKKINVGGQAVIEGVMMRSPDYVSVAVRKANGKIILKRDCQSHRDDGDGHQGIEFLR